MTKYFGCQFVFIFSLMVGQASWAVANSSEAVPKSQFRREFEASMRKGLCEGSKFATECYDMNAEACVENVNLSLAKCFRDHPSLENIPKDKLVAYGTTLGRCAGKNFETRNKSKLRKTNECRNPLPWLGK